ncbi:DUF2207 family protein [Amycolatopsis sp. H20-H5]|uniref:DUF2207 family protein n=1 Tax=Amycolatopsis sp. H20-H5 TaxID=3046309 RepID=UPI002DBC7C80|nr:DUF2207 domain-containing protein [Amycolatopsis sp. H20-H5]MEC3978805.1 DUF2207 domain-containing protein [Amycolatopsis sp. H20-H5]
MKVLAAVAAGLVLTASPAAAQDQPPLPGLPQSAEIQLKAERDGSLSVIEAISVPADATMTRRVPLRVADEQDRDRVYGVRDVVLEGAGSAQVADDVFTVRLAGGTSVLRYTVDGAVSQADGVERVTWELAGGWDTDLKLVRASFAAPSIAAAVDCFAGRPGTDFHCGAAQIDHAGLTRFSQQNLPAGQRMQIRVELPGGTLPVTARLVPSATVAGAFVLTAPVGWAWLGFAVALLAWAGCVWFARRRDARPGDPLPVEPFSAGDEEAAFASPEGVLPGQVGLLLSGRADAVDLAATVLDLAVRNYLWVSEADGDWVLTRRNPPDEHLTGFERAVFAVILPGDTESISLAELRRNGVGPRQVREELYGDVVGRGWRSSGKLAKAGARVVFYGLFLTVLLMFTVGYAQLGMLLALAGAAVAAGGRWLPARRRAGAQLGRRLLGLAERLGATRAKTVPKPRREMVFSRALPYALALGELDHWLSAFGELATPPRLYWLGGDEPSPKQARAFTAVLVGTFSGAGRARLARAVRLPG